MCCVPSFLDTTCNPIQSDTTAPLTLSYHSLARLVVASDTSSPPLYNLYERAATGIGRERRRRRSSAASARRSTCWPSICQYNALSSPPRSAARALQQRGEGRQPASAIAAESTLEREHVSPKCMKRSIVGTGGVALVVVAEATAHTHRLPSAAPLA